MRFAGRHRDDGAWAPWPHQLETPRLGLEPLRVEHADEMAPLLADAQLHRFSGDRPLTPAELRARYARQSLGRSPDGRQQWLNWIVRSRADDASAVGFVQATISRDEHSRGATGDGHPAAELAWTIGVVHQRRGYAREAAREVAAWLGQVGISDLVAHIHPDNEPSMGVARALGLSPTDQIVRGEVRWAGKAPELAIRRGGPEDISILVELFDEAVAWLVSRGQPGQWGEEPFSRRPDGPARLERLAARGGLRVAELRGEAVGALVVGESPAYVSPAERTELYVELLITSRRHAGRRIGDSLVQRAVDEARAAEAEQLRVDCWAGAPRLVAWYRAQGFEPSETFELDGWRGQVLVRSLSDYADGTRPRSSAG